MLVNLVMFLFLFYQESKGASAQPADEEREYLRSLRYKKLSEKKEKMEEEKKRKEDSSIVTLNDDIKSEEIKTIK